MKQHRTAGSHLSTNIKWGKDFALCVGAKSSTRKSDDHDIMSRELFCLYFSQNPCLDSIFYHILAYFLQF